MYNKNVKIFFQNKIRDEVKFSSESELISSIRNDIDKAKVDFKQEF